jgi:hypothetical protein
MRSIVLASVKDVKMHVRTSKIWPTDSSGGNGFGGWTDAIGGRYRYMKDSAQGSASKVMLGNRDLIPRFWGVSGVAHQQNRRNFSHYFCLHCVPLPGEVDVPKTQDHISHTCCTGNCHRTEFAGLPGQVPCRASPPITASVGRGFCRNLSRRLDSRMSGIAEL